MARTARQPRSTGTLPEQLLDRILETAAARGLKQKDLARLASLRAEELSRMKRRGDTWVSDLNRLAAQVGLKVALVPAENLREQIERKTLFVRPQHRHGKAPPARLAPPRSQNVFEARQQEKTAEREATRQAIAAGTLSVEDAKGATRFIADAASARIVHSWDAESWYDPEP